MAKSGDDPDKLRRQLAEHGDRRREALALAHDELEEVLKLTPAAIAAGVSVREIARLGEVSRPTLYARLGRTT